MFSRPPHLTRLISIALILCLTTGCAPSFKQDILSDVTFPGYRGNNYSSEYLYERGATAAEGHRPFISSFCIGTLAGMTLPFVSLGTFKIANTMYRRMHEDDDDDDECCECCDECEDNSIYIYLIPVISTIGWVAGAEELSKNVSEVTLDRYRAYLSPNQAEPFQKGYIDTIKDGRSTGLTLGFLIGIGLDFIIYHNNLDSMNNRIRIFD